MRRRARFHADEAGRQLAEDVDHLTASPLGDTDRSALSDCGSLSVMTSPQRNLDARQRRRMSRPHTANMTIGIPKICSGENANMDLLCCRFLQADKPAIRAMRLTCKYALAQTCKAKHAGLNKSTSKRK
jgi:hypothetical protein